MISHTDRRERFISGMSLLVMWLVALVMWLVMLVLTIYGCEHCYRPVGVAIDMHLFVDHRFGELSYSDAVQAAIDGDAKAVRALSLYRGGDGAMIYQHGLVLIRVIRILTEERYMRLMGQLSSDECSMLTYYLEAGMHEAQSGEIPVGCKVFNVGCLFPELGRYLDSKLPTRTVRSSGAKAAKREADQPTE